MVAAGVGGGAGIRGRRPLAGSRLRTGGVVAGDVRECHGRPGGPDRPQHRRGVAGRHRLRRRVLHDPSDVGGGVPRPGAVACPRRAGSGPVRRRGGADRPRLPVGSTLPGPGSRAAPRCPAADRGTVGVPGGGDGRMAVLRVPVGQGRDDPSGRPTRRSRVVDERDRPVPVDRRGVRRRGAMDPCRRHPVPSGTAPRREHRRSPGHRAAVPHRAGRGVSGRLGAGQRPHRVLRRQDPRRGPRRTDGRHRAAVRAADGSSGLAGRRRRCRPPERPGHSCRPGPGRESRGGAVADERRHHPRRRRVQHLLAMDRGPCREAVARQGQPGPVRGVRAGPVVLRADRPRPGRADPTRVHPRQ